VTLTQNKPPMENVSKRTLIGGVFCVRVLSRSMAKYIFRHSCRRNSACMSPSGVSVYNNTGFMCTKQWVHVASFTGETHAVHVAIDTGETHAVHVTILSGVTHAAHATIHIGETLVHIFTCMRFAIRAGETPCNSLFRKHNLFRSVVAGVAIVSLKVGATNSI